MGGVRFLWLFVDALIVSVSLVNPSMNSLFYSCSFDKFGLGYNESILRLKRHQLNESPKGCTPFWQQILTVSGLQCFDLVSVVLKFVALKFKRLSLDQLR